MPNLEGQKVFYYSPELCHTTFMKTYFIVVDLDRSPAQAHNLSLDWTPERSLSSPIYKLAQNVLLDPEWIYYNLRIFSP